MRGGCGGVRVETCDDSKLNFGLFFELLSPFRIKAKLRGTFGDELCARRRESPVLARERCLAFGANGSDFGDLALGAASEMGVGSATVDFGVDFGVVEPTQRGKSGCEDVAVTLESARGLVSAGEIEQFDGWDGFDFVQDGDVVNVVLRDVERSQQSARPQRGKRRGGSYSVPAGEYRLKARMVSDVFKRG